MMTNLAFLGIYPHAIDSAIENCEEAMKDLGFTVSEIDDMNEAALEDLKEIGTFDDITNSIIAAYYGAAKWTIKERYPEIAVDYYVNCDDSPFTVNRPEIENVRENWEAAVRSMPYFEIAAKIEWGFTPDDLRELARLHKAEIQRQNIEDLLTYCNFRSECSSFRNGEYEIDD